jgi:hypothetical protein
MTSHQISFHIAKSHPFHMEIEDNCLPLHRKTEPKRHFLRRNRNWKEQK